MISWRSFTTSKLLPTFVGESGYSLSMSFSYTETPINNYESASSTVALTSNRSLTSVTSQSVQSEIRIITGEEPGPPFPKPTTSRTETWLESWILSAATSVTENTTWKRGNRVFAEGSITTLIEEDLPTSNSSPLATVTQESTKTIQGERQFRTTQTQEFQSFVYTTTVIGEAPKLSSTTTRQFGPQTQTVIKNEVRTSEKTVTTTTGSPVEFKTYTAIDGDVVVVAHTIWQQTSNTFAVSVNSPATDSPVTQLATLPSRFTVSYSDAYVETLTFQKNRSEFTNSTTQTTTQKTGIPTTRSVFFTKETWKVWEQVFQESVGCDPERTIFRSTLGSNQFNLRDTSAQQTVTNGSETTFQTFNGGEWALGTVLDNNNITVIQLAQTAPVSELSRKTRTFFITNTFSLDTTTFLISGDLTATSTETIPGYIEKYNFPWRSFGDNAKRLFTQPNSETKFHSTTTVLSVPQTTIDEELQLEKTTMGGFVSITEGWTCKSVLTGEFFRKAEGVSFFTNSATAVRAQILEGLASPNLTFETSNTHSTVGFFMSHNAQHTWASPGAGFISQGVVGAVPLYPTFSDLITEGADGWELCDSSEYTTVAGSRVGQNFSTTIAWQIREGTSTKNSTSSGSFTVQSTSTAQIGVSVDPGQTLGGFATPNASRTVIVSPGVVLMTTYDASGSGTLSSSYSTGRTETVAPVGPVPITISSFIPRVQGYGVFTQALLDDGMP